MIVDGKSIARDIGDDIRRRIVLLGRSPRMVVIMVGEHLASQKFVERKERFAQRAGISFEKIVFSDISTRDLCEKIKNLSADPGVDGIVVQLPLPHTVDDAQVLSAIHPAKDPDGLTASPRIIPPVAGAIAEIIRTHRVSIQGKSAVVVGYGRLVGKPVAQWLLDQGAKLRVVDMSTPDISIFTKEADIVVSGVGVSGLITPDMIKDGSVVIDAGTSEAAGKFAGDCDPRCADKASLFTPVPGGVGPITVAVLFRNLLELIARRGNE